MISRRTASALGDAYKEVFSFTDPSGDEWVSDDKVYNDKLYDFLFENEYPTWFCNGVRMLDSPREVKENFMRLHTGETQAEANPGMDLAARERLGQEYLRRLAEDILRQQNTDSLTGCTVGGVQHKADVQLLRSLQLDGYVYRDCRLIAPESDVLDTQEEGGVLATLFSDLKLGNWPTAHHCLNLSEEHWLNGKWDDCISNARRFMECVLQECAAAHSLLVGGVSLPANTFERPVEVRRYLEDKGLLEERERKTVAEVYGLLSNVGSHPNIARKDQARLLRQMGLIFSHFVMLRLKDCLPT